MSYEDYIYSTLPFEQRSYRARIGGLEAARRRLLRQPQTPQVKSRIVETERKLGSTRTILRQGLDITGNVKYWQAVRYYKYTSGPKSNWRAFEIRLDALPFSSTWTRSRVAEEENRIGRIMDRIMETEIEEAFPDLTKGRVDLRSKLRAAIGIPKAGEVSWGDKDFGEVGTDRIRYRPLNEGWEEGDVGTEEQTGVDVGYTVTDKLGRYKNFPRRGTFFWEIPK